MVKQFVLLVLATDGNIISCYAYLKLTLYVAFTARYSGFNTLKVRARGGMPVAFADFEVPLTDLKMKLIYLHLKYHRDLVMCLEFSTILVSAADIRKSYTSLLCYFL